MRFGLTDIQIETVCRRLLAERRHVTVTAVCAALRAQYGSQGRNARVASILDGLKNEPFPVPKPAPPVAIEPTEADRRVYEAEALVAKERAARKAAEERAALAEEREEKHQDFFANRYIERLEESRQQLAREYGAKEREATNRYLSLMRRCQELASRLAKYEDVASILQG